MLFSSILIRHKLLKRLGSNYLIQYKLLNLLWLLQDTELAHTSLIKGVSALKKSGPVPRADPVFVDFCKFGKFRRKNSPTGMVS